MKRFQANEEKMAAPKDDSVRSVIRSILVSNAFEMTASSLDRDFKDMEGYCIPYNKFGYRSLVDYLRSIPDAVKIKGGDPSNPVLVPVAKEEAAHIDKMVRKQKVSVPSHRSRRMPARRSLNNNELVEDRAQSSANYASQNSAKQKKTNFYVARKRQQAALMKLSNGLDDCSTFSLMVASRLRRMPYHQRHMAKMLVNRVLFYGNSGHLSSATYLTNGHYYSHYNQYYDSYY